MANLVESNTWEEGVYQFETTDPVLGGPPNAETGAGIDNLPTSQLANRTSWLKTKVDDLLGLAVAATSAVAGLVRLSTKLEAEAGTDSSGVMTPLRTTDFLAKRVQVSASDTTLGRLLTVGAFGDNVAMPIPGNNMDNAVTGGRYFGYGGAHPSNPTLGPNPFPSSNGAFTVHVARANIGAVGEYVTQTATFIGNGQALTAFRSRGATEFGWGPWLADWSAGNSSFVGGAAGYQRLPSGLIIQWGAFVTNTSNVGAGGTYNPFPLTFPTNCWQVIPTDQKGDAGTTARAVTHSHKSVSGFRAIAVDSSGTPANATVSYIAIGN